MQMVEIWNKFFQMVVDFQDKKLMLASKFVENRLIGVKDQNCAEWWGGIKDFYILSMSLKPYAVNVLTHS